MENRKFSLPGRLIHWAIALIVLLILFTIFLRWKWMNPRYMANILEGGLGKLDISLSPRDLRRTAAQITKVMWKWHIYLGYVLTGLYLIRVFLVSIKKAPLKNPFYPTLPLKSKLEAWAYLIFYLCIALSLSTGLWLVKGPKRFHGLMEDIHGYSIYYLLAFLILHLGGVLLAEFGKEKGIISKMISGK